jgi:hypothetical protein
MLCHRRLIQIRITQILMWFSQIIRRCDNVNIGFLVFPFFREREGGRGRGREREIITRYNRNSVYMHCTILKEILLEFDKLILEENVVYKKNR